MKGGRPAKQVVLLARSREGNEELEGRLKHLQVSRISVDTVEFLPPEDDERLEMELKGIREYSWVVFTSPRAVASVDRRLKQFVGTRGLKTKFGAVGPSTAARLNGLGLRVDYVPEKYLTSELASGLPAKKGDRVLLLRADIAERKMVGLLRSRGFEVVECPAYRTKVLSGRARVPRPGEVGAVVFASPSEVRGLERRIPKEALASIRANATALCIGPVTEKAAKEAGFRKTLTPTEYTIDALVRLTTEAAAVA